MWKSLNIESAPGVDACLYIGLSPQKKNSATKYMNDSLLEINSESKKAYVSNPWILKRDVSRIANSIISKFRHVALKLAGGKMRQGAKSSRSILFVICLCCFREARDSTENLKIGIYMSSSLCSVRSHDHRPLNGAVDTESHGGEERDVSARRNRQVALHVLMVTLSPYQML